MLSIVFFLNSIEEKAQNSSPQKISCDCSDAIKININNTTTYGLTQAPEGCGRQQEITTSNKHSLISFEKEHNSAAGDQVILFQNQSR